MPTRWSRKPHLHCIQTPGHWTSPWRQIKVHKRVRYVSAQVWVHRSYGTFIQKKTRVFPFLHHQDTVPILQFHKPYLAPYLTYKERTPLSWPQQSPYTHKCRPPQHKIKAVLKSSVFCITYLSLEHRARFVQGQWILYLYYRFISIENIEIYKYIGFYL